MTLDLVSHTDFEYNSPESYKSLVGSIDTHEKLFEHLKPIIDIQHHLVRRSSNRDQNKVLPSSMLELELNIEDIDRLYHLSRIERPIHKDDTVYKNITHRVIGRTRHIKRKTYFDIFTSCDIGDAADESVENSYKGFLWVHRCAADLITLLERLQLPANNTPETPRNPHDYDLEAIRNLLLEDRANILLRKNRDLSQVFPQYIMDYRATYRYLHNVEIYDKETLPSNYTLAPPIDPYTPIDQLPREIFPSYYALPPPIDQLPMNPLPSHPLPRPILPRPILPKPSHPLPSSPLPTPILSLPGSSLPIPILPKPTLPLPSSPVPKPNHLLSGGGIIPFRPIPVNPLHVPVHQLPINAFNQQASTSSDYSIYTPPLISPAPPLVRTPSFLPLLLPSTSYEGISSNSDLQQAPSPTTYPSTAPVLYQTPALHDPSSFEEEVPFNEPSTTPPINEPSSPTYPFTTRFDPPIYQTGHGYPHPIPLPEEDTLPPADVSIIYNPNPTRWYERD